MDLMLWNIALTGALGLVSWFARTMWAEVQRLSILLNRTREEINMTTSLAAVDATPTEVKGL